MALGAAFLRLGEREGGSGRIEEEAVTVYREALKEETRERDLRPMGRCANRPGLRYALSGLMNVKVGLLGAKNRSCTKRAPSSASNVIG